MADKPITPTSVTERPISDADKRALAEQEAIRQGVADVTFAWAYVENFMVMLLAEIIRDEPMGSLSSAIYFTPASLEIRINVVSNALRRLLANSAAEEPVLAKWDSLMNTLGRLRKTRNMVAHGQLVTFGEHEGKPSFSRLTTPMFKAFQEIAAGFVEGKKPGLGSNELRTSAKAVNRAAIRVSKFRECVRHFRLGNDVATLLQILDAGEGEILNPPHLSSPTPPEP